VHANGIALSIWQNVETQHYHLFLNLLGTPAGEIPSVVYFGIESFDARRTMVDRMVQPTEHTAPSKCLHRLHLSLGRKRSAV
jgi:hypothetical protein